MRWLLKMLLRLAVLGLLVFVGWALIAELPPPSGTRTIPLPPPGEAAGSAG